MRAAERRSIQVVVVVIVVVIVVVAVVVVVSVEQANKFAQISGNLGNIHDSCCGRVDVAAGLLAI